MKNIFSRCFIGGVGVKVQWEGRGRWPAEGAYRFCCPKEVSSQRHVHSPWPEVLRLQAVIKNLPAYQHPTGKLPPIP